GLDRTDGLSQPLGELRLGEAAVVRELERLALLIGKLPQRGLHALALVAQPDEILRRPFARTIACRLDRLCATAFLAPDEVDRAPVHDGQQPRGGLCALRHERVGPAPRAQKRLLYRVLGERIVSADAQSEAVGDAPDAVVML